MAATASPRGASISGGIFALTFFVGLFLVGDQAGAFADSERAYAEIFSDTSHRVQDLIGSALLMVSAIALAAFAHLVVPPIEPSTRPDASSVLVRVGGTLASVAILVAGGAFLTVPASLAIGAFFDDPGIVTAQPLLPHFGYVMLVFGAVLPAAVLMVASTRLGVFRRWFVWATPVIAVLLVVTAPSVVALALLPIWVAVAAIVRLSGRQTPT